jgi:hypothetical protein
MQSLKEFYKKLYLEIDQANRYITVLEIDDVIVVNFDTLFDRECSIRGSDQLIYLLHKLGQDKRFIFLSEDGALLQQSGAIEIIKNVIDCFSLNCTTCLIVCRETLDIPNADTINIEATPYWCLTLYPTIKDISIPTGPFNKKFAVWFNRGTFYRLQLAQYLTEKYKEDSYVSYQESGMIIDRKLKEYFQDDADWASTNTPIVYDQLFPNRMYTHDMIVGASRKPYDDYFMELIGETDTLTTNWITEKTVKNLYIGKPFIVMGGPGILDKIRSFGFQTFSPWIDESYDLIKNNYQRLEAIKREIDRIANKSTVELQEMHQQLLPVFGHNRKEYIKNKDV